MMTIIPTRRPWITAPRLALAVALVAVASSAVLLLGGTDPAVMACLALAP